MINKFLPALAVAASSCLTFSTPSFANPGLLARDLRDFSATAGYSQGSDGHVILDCWRRSWGNGEAIIAEWRLRSYHSSLLYINGAVDFSVSSTPRALNGSPAGFSVPNSRVTSGSEEIYLDEPLPPEWQPIDVFATIAGVAQVGIESGIIIPTTANCPFRYR